MSQYGGQWLGLWPGVWIGDGDSPVVGANLVLRWNVQAGTTAVGGDFSPQWNITGTAGNSYVIGYRVEGSIPEALVDGGGGPDEWIHPRVRKYLDDLRKRVVEERYKPAREVLETDGVHIPVRVGSIPAPASIDDADDLEEIEELLMLID